MVIYPIFIRLFYFTQQFIVLNTKVSFHFHLHNYYLHYLPLKIMKKKIPRKQHFYKNHLSLAWKNLSSYTQVLTVNAGIEKIRYTQSECEKALV